MIIGHLPAGYLAAKAVARSGASAAMFWGIMIGSVLPDIDLLWFFLIDSSVHHHHLITHRPVVWVALLIVAVLLRSPFFVGLGLGTLLHVILDTTLGEVAWFWPLSDTYVTFIEVQPTHDHWLKSFMVHWTFRVELALAAPAVFVLWLSRRQT